jgi:uncharacterized protein (TIGR02147 family)
MHKMNELLSETSIFQFQSYRAYLKSILELNQKRSPKLTLRTFALFLGVSSAHLSQVLAGKQDLSSDLILQSPKN